MVSRALERTGSDRHPPPLTSGVATSIGSLPHRDAHEAAAFVIATHADLPAAPQLPRRSPRERMVAQGAAGIDGVTVDATGVVRITHALCTEALVASTFDDGWGGTLAFLDVIAGRRKPVKLQLTGPVTLGLALLHAGADASVAFRVAGRAVAARAAALVDLAGSVAPGVPLVVFLDEPGLGAAGHPGFPLPAEHVVDLLAGSLAAVGPSVTTGVHCCANSGWQLALRASPDVVSLPATASVTDHAPVLASFLESGGWVAWGAVPTTGPVGDEPDPCWRRLVGLWCELMRAGCDPGLLRRQALVTPACGLAEHGVTQAARVLRLTTQIAERVQDQAIASRLSVGA